MARRPPDASREPATRVLHARELQAHLRQAERADEPSTQARTRFFRRAGEPRMRFGAKVPRAAPPDPAGHADVTVASLDVASFRAAAPRLGLAPPRAASIHTERMATPPEPAPSKPRPVKPRLLALSGLAALAVGFVALSSMAGPTLRHDPPLAVARTAPLTHLVAPPAPASSRRVPEPRVAPGQGATRRALDALLDGRTRDALDQYRALSLSRPGDGALSQLVRLLEHELSACRPGEAACR